MSLTVKILGSNAATPAHNRNQSAQFLTSDQEHFLIDCGEATQIQLIKYKVKFHKIDFILISHLHGDHYLGLMGLLLTLHLQRREQDLTIYGPQGLDEIITLQLKHSGTTLNYPLHFVTVDPTKNKLILETHSLNVYSIPLVHRVPCSGFLFKEKPKDRRFDKTLLHSGLTGDDIVKLKHGQDVFNSDGTVKYRSLDYTLPPRPAVSYAYCSDTKYHPPLVRILEGVDLLYHEATFGKENEIRAAETFHSTTEQAAKIAKAANAKQLMLGHFSVRYRDLSPLQAEAKEVFQNTILAIEGESYEIG